MPRSSSLCPRSALAALPIMLAAVASGSCAGGGSEKLGRDVSATIVCAKGPTTPGLDVSYYQGTIDWAAVKSGGYQFALIRTSDGYFEDPQFSSNWAGAKSAGLLRGAYHYFRPGKDPAQQADLVISKVGRLAADDLPVGIEVEAQDGQTIAAIVANLHSFYDRVQAGTGKKPMIYTAAWFWDPNVHASEFLSTSLWVSDFGAGCPNLPATWSDWVFNQYTDAASVPGISGGVDLDVFNGSLSELRTFAQAASSCSPELCNGQDDDCDGVVDNGEVCEREALLRDLTAYAPPTTTDVDGDGRADVCARGSAGVLCYLSRGTSWSTVLPKLALSDADGWGEPRFYATLRMGDIDGDGKADVCARSAMGVSCWTGSAAGFGARIAGPDLTDASGWGAIEYYSTLRLADVTGDGKDDLCALAAKGLVCWPSQIAHGAGDFGAEIAGPAWSTPNGFSSARYYGTLRMGDVNGDGKADACLRGPLGVECWLSDGNGFPTKIAGPELSDAAGWGLLQYWHSIRLADVDGDGRADLCARSRATLRCWRSRVVGSAGGFDEGVDVADLSDAQGWDDPSNYRTLRVGDVDGDGADDLCIRANAQVWCWRWTGSAFASIAGPEWSDARGLNAPKYFDTLRVGDFDGDGRADLCVRTATGLRCVPSNGGGFGGEIALNELTDQGGWGVEPYYPTVMLGGARRGGAPGADAGTDAASDPNARDAGDAEGGIDGGRAPSSAEESSGCACRTGSGSRASAERSVAVGALALALARRRRRRAP